MEIEITNRLTTLGHPNRLALFRLLMRRYPDAVPAGEIAAALGIKPNTASAYLAALSQAGLVVHHRKGTSLLYRVEMEAAKSLVRDIFLECCGGRPDLCPPFETATEQGDSPMSDRKFDVLFICTGNSARSIFGESILRAEAGDRFNAYSAGTRPHSELNPLAVEMLKAKGHDITPLAAKNVSVFQGADAPRFDFVFTVCDRAANEECPSWEGQPISAHWGMPDPVKATGSTAERMLAFQQAYGALRNRIAAFAALPVETLDRVSLQHHVDEIGRNKEDA